MKTQTELNWLDSQHDRLERTEVLAWDGRLDNRADLVVLLTDSLRGNTSNAALARAAYERWGPSGFVHLIGDWSVVIRDHANHTIVLASDFAGVRPLYYHVQPERVLWSSRLQSIVDATGICELDEQYVRGFLLFGGCPNRTPYRGIYSVPSGHAVCVSSEATKVHRFWALPNGVEGVHISADDQPIITETQVGNATPEAFQPLRTSIASIANTLGVKTILTGMNGDLMMGNWFDDSLQVTASLRQFRIGRAFEEALAWSKILRLPVYSVLRRAIRAALPPSLAPAAIYAAPDGSCMPKSTETSLVPAFGDRTAHSEAESLFSDAWMQARPERRKHFRSLTTMLELRALQPPEPLQHLDYTHPFAHRPLVEFLMAVPPDVLCRPGEPRRLMRSALSDLWPLKLRARRSKGLFNAPWQKALRPLAHILLKASQLHLVESGFVDRTSVLSRLQRLSSGLDCNESQLRQIILLELWLRNRADGRLSGQVLRAA